MNRFLVINSLRRKRKLSRTELARELGITRPAITNIVADLISEGYVRECGMGDAVRGRKPVLLELNSSAAYVIGAHLQHDECVEASLVNLDCEILHHIERPPTEMSASTLVAEIRAGVDQLMAGVDIPRQAVFGVGVGVPAIMDYETGIVIGCSFNLDFVGVPLRAQIQQAVGLPAYVDNSPNTAALGEWWYGTAVPRRDFIYIWIGQGVGCGMIVGGHVYRGAHGAASQFGHVIVQADGPRCRCGSRGCVEVFASEPAVLAWVASQMQSGRSSQMEKAPQEPRELYDAANAGDALAREAIQVMGHYLGIGISNLVNLLNPETVVIGGGVWRVMDLLLEEVRATVAKNAVTVKGKKTRIIPSSLGAETDVIGAATLALEELFQAPVFEPDTWNRGGGEQT